MYDVFVSYAREEAAAARSIKTMLEGHGYSVFLDTTELQVGEDFSQNIDKALRDSSAVVGVWSRHSLTKSWGVVSAASRSH